MPTVRSNDIQIAYEIQGEGQPFVLIAGIGYSRWCWHKIVPDLAEDFQVITFDNRGAGASEKPGGPYTVAMMAADTAGLLNALNIRGAFVMGYSLGGFIAQELTLAHPELVSKLILASTNHGGMNVIPITPEAMNVLTNREGDPEELVSRGITVATAPGFAEREPGIEKELIEYRFTNPVPPEQYQAQVMAGVGMAAYSEDQVASRMGSIDVPVLILFGEHDKVVPPGNADLMAEKLPNAIIKILPNTGHLFPIEDPEGTVKAIKEFLLSD